MYQDASCWTGPSDETELDGDTASRWFVGLQRTAVARVEQSSVQEKSGQESDDRTIQRFEDVQGQAVYSNLEIDPADVIEDDGMFM